MVNSVEVYETLRDDIVHGRFRPMDVVDMQRLSEEYVISTSPVRDAVLRLSELGLIEWKRNRGFFIKDVSMETSLFYLDQIQNAYVYAILRSEKTKNGYKITDKRVVREKFASPKEYIKWHNLQFATLFSETEWQYLTNNWNKIWHFRNRYLSCDDTRYNLYNGWLEASLLLSDDQYKNCISTISDNFKIVNLIYNK